MKTAKRITLATIKSFIRKNRDELLIQSGSTFDGMVDCVMPCEDNEFSTALPSDSKHNVDRDLGIHSAWFVGSSRDYFEVYSDGTFTGYKVSNCCGRFTLAIKNPNDLRDMLSEVK